MDTNRPHKHKTEKQIRKEQSLIFAQIEGAYRTKNTKALERLQEWELDLQNELLYRI